MKANVTTDGIELIPENGADEFVLKQFDHPNGIRVASSQFDNKSGDNRRISMLIVPVRQAPLETRKGVREFMEAVDDRRLSSNG
jgi:hypothetical protein